MSTGPAVSSLQATGTSPSRETVLQRVGSITVPVSVQLCRRKMTLGELSALGPGSFIPFSTKCDQPLELRVDRATIAEGEAVRFGSQLGWRLSHFVDEKSSL